MTKSVRRNVIRSEDKRGAPPQHVVIDGCEDDLAGRSARHTNM
jgi:hypothetical protein